MNVEEKINKIGESFRGLWRTCEIGPDNDITETKWSVTFEYKGKMVETPYCHILENALDYVIKKLGS